MSLSPQNLAILLVLSPLVAALLTWRIGRLAQRVPPDKRASRLFHSLQVGITIFASAISLILAILLVGRSAMDQPLQFVILTKLRLKPTSIGVGPG
jgi:hypothetical protein